MSETPRPSRLPKRLSFLKPPASGFESELGRGVEIVVVAGLYLLFIGGLLAAAVLLLFADDPDQARSRVWLGIAVGIGSLLGLVAVTVALFGNRDKRT